jgi:hypothetical protein
VKHTPAKQYREPKNIPKQLYPIGFWQKCKSNSGEEM